MSPCTTISDRVVLTIASLAFACAPMAMACQFNPGGLPAQGTDAGGPAPDAGIDAPPGPSCGDGVVDSDEQCDGADLDGQTCVSLQHAAGDLACTTGCTFDESGCLNPVEPWYDTAWQYRKTITIAAAEVGRDQSNFPVMIALRGDPDLMAAARSDGADILFTAEDSISKLDHEVETYDDATGTLIAWVRVPLLSGADDTELYVYYGNESAAPQENPDAVWDGNFTVVYHLSDAAGTTFPDSSGAGNDGTENNFEGDETVAGKIGMAQELDGSNEYIAIPAAATSGNDRFTMCLWINTDESGNHLTYFRRPSMIGQETFGWDSGDFGITSNSGELGMWSGLANSDNDALSGASINDQTWHHVCAVNDGTSVYLMLDGSEVSKFDSNRALNDKGFWLGGQNSGGYYHAGQYDELQISDTNRSMGWVVTSYNNQGRPDDFYAVGDEEYYLQ